MTTGSQHDRVQGRSGLIVVGVDGSDPSVAALRWAIGEAARSGVRVEAVYVYAPPVEPGWYVDERHPTPLPPERQAVITSAERELGRAVRRVARDLVDVPLSTVVVPDVCVAVALARLAEHADLLVIGGHPASAIDRLFGSTSTAILNAARCPVVVVPDSDGTGSREAQLVPSGSANG